MQKTKLNILSTRPLDKGIIETADQQNITIDCISFIETETIGDENLKNQILSLQEKNITAVFTSMNAVEAVRHHLTAKPGWVIYSIGQTTKELAAETFGKENIIGTANNAAQLADEIIKDNQKELYFFCGDQRRDELPNKLKASGIKLKEIVVYKTTQQAKTINKEYDGILFFSPSAVHSFFSANAVDKNTLLFAIGDTTAEAIRQYTNNNIIIAERPGKEALVQRMMEYFSATQKQNN